MAISYLIEDTPQYVSRGDRILSVLEGSGSVEVLPGRPDVEASQSDWDKREKFNPDIPFSPESFSRMDKFDALEAGQAVIDEGIASTHSSTKEDA